jgi:hypothetical protein
MKMSSCFVALLLLIALAAPSLSQETGAPSPSRALVRPVAAASSSCPAGTPQFFASIPQNPPAVPASPFPPLRCGSCSSWDCVGAPLNGQCWNGRPFEGLVCVDNGVCTADGSLQCTCTYPN